MPTMSCPVWDEVDLTLPGHHAEDVEREQDAGGMEFGVGLLQESGDDVGALRAAGWRLGMPTVSTRRTFAPPRLAWRRRLCPGLLGFASAGTRRGGRHHMSLSLLASGLSCFRLIFLEDELGVFLVAFGGEADVVELDFVDAELGYVFGEGDVIVLDLGVRGIGPDQLAVLAPGGVVLAGLDGEFGMRHDQALVAEHGDAGDGVHVLLVQEVHELGHVVDVDLVLAEQRVLEGNVDAAVGVLDVEDDGVAADFAPVLDDAEAVIAGGHDSGEVNGADFEVPGNGDCFLGDRGGEDSGDDDILVGLQDIGGVGFVIRGADGVGQFRRRQIRSLAKIVAGDRRDRFSALGGIEFGAGSGDRSGIGDRELGGSGVADGMQLRRRLRRRDDGLGRLSLRSEFGGGMRSRDARRRLRKRRQEIPVMTRTDE